MKTHKFIGIFSLLIIFAVTAFSLTGCGPQKITLSDNEKSPKGIALENFLPEDIFMSLSVNNLDRDQSAQLQTFKSYFPDDVDEIMAGALEDLILEIEEAGLDYKEDVQPILPENFKLIFGMKGEIEKEDPDVYFAITVNDIEKTKQLFDKIIENNTDITKGELFGAITLDMEDENTAVALYEDVILVTSNKELRLGAIRRMKHNEPSLLSNERFKNIYEQMPKPNLGYAYINLNEMMTMIAKQLEEAEEQEIDMEIFEAIIAEGFTFTANEDGINIIVQVAFNPDTELGQLAELSYKEPYMYKEIPGEDIIMYSEAYGISQIFDMEKNILFYTEDSQSGYRFFKGAVKGALKLDLEEDILAWMDKGYALVFQRNEGLIPGISIYIDASSDTEKAEELVKVIDAGMLSLINELSEGMALEDLDPEKFIVKEELEQGINHVAFKFDEMTEEELATGNLPLDIFVAPIEFYYGILDNDYFVLSTYNGLMDDFEGAMKVADNPVIQQANAYLKDYPYQFSYISVEEIWAYINGFIEVMEKSDGPLPKDIKEGFENANEYLAPIKYLVGGNKKVENVAEALLFLRLEKPEIEEEVVEEEVEVE